MLLSIVSSLSGLLLDDDVGDLVVVGGGGDVVVHGGVLSSCYVPCRRTA